MGRLKSLLRQTIGYNAFLKVAIIQKKLKPKKITKKPIAFLFGFSEWKHSYIKAYLSKYEVIFIKDNENINYIINEAEKFKNKVFMVWGYKDRPRVIKYAQKNRIPYYRIEDGFIRSVELGASKSTPISLSIDSKALYYDATKPSDLEDLLNEYDFNSDKVLMARAANCIEMLRGLNISKYNNVDSKNINNVYGKKLKKRILVIGQVEDDESIKRGCSKPMTNNDLVWLAKMENPDAEIIYKPHPDVLFGKRAMQSNPDDVRHLAKVITEPLSLTDAFETIDHVYTITSLSGFEALLRGIKVTTFGAPFYSGWGLTDDRQTTGRRNRKLSVEEIFAAAYILYPKYMHPITKEFISIEEAIKTIKCMKDLNTRNLINEVNSFKSTLDFSIPKEDVSKIGVMSKGIKAIPNLQSFLKGELIFNPSERVGEIDYVAGWGMKPSAKKAIEFCEKHNIPYLGLEDGFLRSIGLGVDGSPPLSICLDDVGIYYDATRPSRLENILNSSGWETEQILNDAEEALALIRKNYLSKYNHAPMVEGNTFVNNGKKRVLIVDQTLGDMSISLGLADKEQFKQMYEKAKKDNPDADIFIKTHPDVISGKKEGNLTHKDVGVSVRFLYNDCNPLSLLEQVDKVYVVTSQFGFEALMLGKEVHCFGMPFYAGWGVTKDEQKVERRIKQRSVTEIFAAAYLLYPRYIHPETGMPGTIFDVINYLAVHRPQV